MIINDSVTANTLPLFLFPNAYSPHPGKINDFNIGDKTGSLESLFKFISWEKPICNNKNAVMIFFEAIRRIM